MDLKNEKSEDLGKQPVIININKETCLNNNFRKTIWTGDYLQVTVMSIPAGGEIGLEIHDNIDQFIRVEYGVASVYMGKTKESVTFMGFANPSSAIIVPAGSWHNILNKQKYPLKVYSIYAPVKHKKGSVHKTKLDSDLQED